MLTTQQYKFLKKLLKKDIPCGDLRENYDAVYMYHLKKGFISYYNVCPPGDIMEENAVLYCKITEEGKVELLLHKQERYHFWIPTIISIIAIITSICAILTQNAELYQLLKQLLQ